MRTLFQTYLAYRESNYTPAQALAAAKYAIAKGYSYQPSRCYA